MFLGLDLGTSSVKVIVINDDGEISSKSSQSLSLSSPNPLWNEQSPSDWLEAAETAILKIPKKIRSKLKGMGLSGQMHGAVLLDKKERPIRPAILWNDGRSFEECKELEKELPNLNKITGNQVMPGFTSPKIEWVRKYEKENFSAIQKILLPKDYLRLKWSGEFATDTSDASGTMWLNTKKRSWSNDALEISGISSQQLPELFEGNQITGKISKSFSKKLGIPMIPIVAGAGDQAAGAIGSSVINPGDASLVLGTSGVIFLVTDGFLPNLKQGIHAFCHAVPQTWHQMAVILSAASAVDWCANLVGYDYPAKAYKAAEKKGDSENIMFLPYLNGERTPHNNPHASAALFGLKSNTNRASIIHAALEGVAFALSDGYKALVEGGGKCNTISVIGGGSQSTYWGKIIANCLNKTLVYRDGSETGPAKGAAILAQSGVTGKDLKSLCKPSPIIEVIEPEKNYTELYHAKIKKWQLLYQETKNLNQ